MSNTHIINIIKNQKENHNNIKDIKITRTQNNKISQKNNGTFFLLSILSVLSVLFFISLLLVFKSFLSSNSQDI
jgi:hypothetical protein